MSFASAEGQYGCQISARTSLHLSAAITRISQNVQHSLGNVASGSRKATHTHTEEVAASIAEAIRSNATPPSIRGVIALFSLAGENADSGLGIPI